MVSLINWATRWQFFLFHITAGNVLSKTRTTGACVGTMNGQLYTQVVKKLRCQHLCSHHLGKWRWCPGGFGWADWCRRYSDCREEWPWSSGSPPAIELYGWWGHAQHWQYCWASMGCLRRCCCCWSLSPSLVQAPEQRFGLGGVDTKGKGNNGM